MADMALPNVTNPLPSVDVLPRGCIWTPEIEKVLTIATEQIRMDLPGMLVGGMQRNGKSEASKYLAAVLPSYLNYPVGVVRWTIADDGMVTKRCFYQERLLQSGYSAINQRDLGVLRGRLFDHLAELAASQGARRFVLIIDEAQNLTKLEYGQLVYIFNELERRDLTPFMLLIGQPELLELSTRWLHANTLQYLGRFCSRTHQFLGISLDDIGEVLSGFDDEAEGPESTAAYRTSPQAYAEGWRVAELANVMRRSVKSMLVAQNIVETVRMPMQYVRSFLAAILHKITQDGIDPRLVPDAVVIDCLKATGFATVVQFHVVNGNGDGKGARKQDVAE